LHVTRQAKTKMNFIKYAAKVFIRYKDKAALTLCFSPSVNLRLKEIAISFLISYSSFLIFHY
jgi:hypothetical protein